MSPPPARLERAREALGRLPVPALVLLAVLLATAPVGLALSHNTPEAPRSGDTLADVARKAGCRLREYDDGRVSTNPPVTGRMVERAITTDGSHIGKKPPSLDATTHALLHGRVLIQYGPGLPESEVLRLDELVNEAPEGVLGFANQTGMTSPIAATAYLNLLTCPRVTARTLHALRVFRDRRRAFGNAF
jgi:hypothetical protein